MIIEQPKFRIYTYALFVLASLTIIADFIIPGRIIIDEIINVKKERQQYYNAAQNYHYSYELYTNEHQFSISEDFAAIIEGEEKVQFSLSRIFKEVNWYNSLFSNNRAVFSLRILSGFLLPLFFIISILVTYLYKKNIGILVFVLQVLIILDLIFLMN